MAVKNVTSVSDQVIDGEPLKAGQVVGTVDGDVFTCSVAGGQLGVGHICSGLMAGTLTTEEPKNTPKPATRGKGK